MQERTHAVVSYESQILPMLAELLAVGEISSLNAAIAIINSKLEESRQLYAYIFQRADPLRSNLENWLVPRIENFLGGITSLVEQIEDDVQLAQLSEDRDTLISQTQQKIAALIEKRKGIERILPYVQLPSIHR